MRSLLQVFHLCYYLLLELTPRDKNKVHRHPVFPSFTLSFPEVGNQWKVDTQVCFKTHSHGSFQLTHVHYPIIIIMTQWIREVDIIIPLLPVRKLIHNHVLMLDAPSHFPKTLPPGDAKRSFSFAKSGLCECWYIKDKCQEINKSSLSKRGHCPNRIIEMQQLMSVKLI